MRSRFAGFCILALPLWGTTASVGAVRPDTGYPPAAKRLVAHALIQKVAQLEVQYTVGASEYTATAPIQQNTESSLRALRLRLTQLRPDGYRREVTKAVRHALVTRIAAQEVEVALDNGNKFQQSKAETRLLSLRRHLAILPQTPYAEDQRLARL